MSASTIYLEQHAAHRFVVVERDGARTLIRYGAVGTTGKVREVLQPDEAAAVLDGQKRIAHLIRKGYVPGRTNLALLKALQASPEDLEGHRRYRDWLAEQGDPRAELIELGLTMAGTMRGPRFEALLAEHPIALDVGTWTRSPQRWQLGFIREGAFSPPDPRQWWASRGAALRRYLQHPSSALMQRLILRVGSSDIVGVISRHAPRTLREVLIEWTPEKGMPDAHALLGQWKSSLPLLERVECSAVPHRVPQPVPLLPWWRRLLG